MAKCQNYGTATTISTTTTATTMRNTVANYAAQMQIAADNNCGRCSIVVSGFAVVVAVAAAVVVVVVAVVVVVVAAKLSNAKCQKCCQHLNNLIIAPTRHLNCCTETQRERQT